MSVGVCLAVTYQSAGRARTGAAASGSGAAAGKAASAGRASSGSAGAASGAPRRVLCRESRDKFGRSVSGHHRLKASLAA